MADWIRMARSPHARRFGRVIALVNLSSCGRVPEDLAGDVPSLPVDTPEPPRRPAIAIPPAHLVASAAGPTTLDLLRRLAPIDGPEDLEVIARDLAEEWDDWGPVNCHRNRPGPGPSEAVSREFVLGLYQQCRAADLPGRSRAGPRDRPSSDGPGRTRPATAPR